MRAINRHRKDNAPLSDQQLVKIYENALKYYIVDRPPRSVVR